MNVEKKTYLLDSVRGANDGILLAAIESVFLVVAIQLFHVSDLLKAIFSSASYIGMIFALFYFSHFSHSNLKKSTLAAVPFLLASVFLLLSFIYKNGTWFTLTISAAILVISLPKPFLSSIYEQNYPKRKRGQLYSTALFAGMTFSVLFSYFFGVLLKNDLNNVYFIITVCISAGIISFFAIKKIPSTIPGFKGGRNPLKNLKYFYEDKLFGYILTAWFIFGFANLCIRPLRVVYLAEAERGLNLSPLMIAFLMVIIPEGTRMIFVFFWGKLFDKINFILLRIILCVFLAAGIFLYFLTPNLYLIGLANFLMGIGYSGGYLMWNLWVTKIAPPDKTHVYMSVHTFLCGVRGIIAPAVGLYLSRIIELKYIGIGAFIIIILSTAMMVPVYMKNQNTV